MMNFELSGSVGKSGDNNQSDVLALKSRLIELGYDWLSIDSPLDSELFQVINLVQSIKAGRNKVKGDSIVDVPGPTYKWLRASNAPRWQLMPEGAREQGFFNVERADTKDTHDFGTDWMADTIRGAGAFYRDNYLATHPSAALLTINDVSLPRGGDTNDHSGHETGLACDLRLPRVDGTAPGNTRHTDTSIYDRETMRAMLRAVRGQPMVTRILFNDKELIKEGLCQRADGHDNHAHFEIAPLQPVMGYQEPIDDLLMRAIRMFKGHVVDPVQYRLTVEGFQDYLDDTGVVHFSATEMLTPHHPDTARKLGYTIFLPPYAWWPRGAALALISDHLRKLVGEPVVMRNWWRPVPYNRAVDGAEDGDHVTAHGVDLDYKSADSRRQAERELRMLYDNEKWLQMSLGLGNRTTHVGILSPGRKRDWFYQSYVP